MKGKENAYENKMWWLNVIDFRIKSEINWQIINFSWEMKSNERMCGILFENVNENEKKKKSKRRNQNLKKKIQTAVIKYIKK